MEVSKLDSVQSGDEVVVQVKREEGALSDAGGMWWCRRERFGDRSMQGKSRTIMAMRTFAADLNVRLTK